MRKPKPRVLLNWDTTRKDLLQPFLDLQHDIQFVIIWGDPSNNDVPDLPFERLYFSKYWSPYALLKAAKVEKIIFFNINSFPQVSLNMAAKNWGIPTYVMHHGIHDLGNLEIHKELEKQEIRSNSGGISVRTMLFYFLALGFKNSRELIPYIKYAFIRKRRNRVMAAKSVVFEGRVPDFYINLSPFNALINKDIDQLNCDDKLIYIGHPFFDDIINSLNSYSNNHNAPQKPYFLLIDFPNISSHNYFQKIGAERKIEFYKRLSAIAKSSGCRLKIKLHPFGYDSKFNYEDENIDLVRDSNVAELIHFAEKCFGFFSTLLIPIIYHKKEVFLFHMGDDRVLQKSLVELGLAIKLDINTFSSIDLNTQTNFTRESFNTFISRYLYFTDGKCTDRLKNVLLSKCD